MNEHIDDGIVKIVFVKSADYDSKSLTKNLGSELNEKQGRYDNQDWSEMIVSSSNIKFKNSSMN